MARIPYRSASEAPPGLAAELEELPPLNLFGLVAHAESVFGPWRRFSAALLNEAMLSAELRELAILRVASLSPGAEYEWEQHLVLAREVGLSEERIESARSGRGLGAEDSAVLDFTTEVVRDVGASEPTWERIRDLLDERAIVELLLLIGQYMMVARIAATLAVDPDPPVGSQLYDQLG